MAFITKNDGFVCESCHEANPPAPKTCRDHCRKCLLGKHVDGESPGDRASKCHGIMEPIAVLPGTKKTDYVLLYKCQKCGLERKNRAAPDDNLEAILKIASERIFRV